MSVSEVSSAFLQLLNALRQAFSLDVNSSWIVYELHSSLSFFGRDRHVCCLSPAGASFCSVGGEFQAVGVLCLDVIVDALAVVELGEVGCAVWQGTCCRY